MKTNPPSIVDALTAKHRKGLARAWTDVLDDFLTWLETECPDFEIHQVKMKFRSLRFYVGTKTDLFLPNQRVRSEISKLEKLLSLPKPQPNVKLTDGECVK
jgi:hypothetical protein